ncbi:type II toxin-antitoxin system HicB family antitoxin [Salmonella enterica subsp. enterica serovar Saintpaul]|nr:type II toxin-antitoxin system HicB family antitoxin [Salmonella enterica subsp. enterica serovar Saintpaul]
MMNTLKIDGVTAVLHYDPEIEKFHGTFIGLNGVANFYGSSVTELKAEAGKALAGFLAECAEEGIEPYVKGKHTLKEMIAQVTPENSHAAIDAGAPKGNEKL